MYNTVFVRDLGAERFALIARNLLALLQRRRTVDTSIGVRERGHAP